MKTLAWRDVSFRIAVVWDALAMTAWFDGAKSRAFLLVVSFAMIGEASAQSLKFQPPSPVYDEVVFGSTVSLMAAASGFTPTKVEFLLDGKVIATDTSAPFTAQVTGLKPGIHGLEVRANPMVAGVGDGVRIEVLELSGTKLLGHNFNYGHVGWAYQDDVFRGTNQPKYAQGIYGATERTPPLPRVELGGVDHSDITGMSGGYVTTLWLNAASEAQVRLEFEVQRGQEFEEDETFDVMMSVDNVLRGLEGADYIQRIPDESGGGRVTVPLGRLAAGAHRLVIGAYANKKTELAEREFVGIHWVLVETLPAPNVLPTVTITSPADGAHLPSEIPVNLTATASDADGKLTRVEFFPHEGYYVSTVEDSTPPYSFTHLYYDGTFTAKVAAFDKQGARTVDGVSFTVGNPPPVVVLTSPVGEVYVKKGATLQLRVNASDVGGAVQRVEAEVDGVVKATDFTAPYVLNVPMTDLREDGYSTLIRTVAWDNAGASGYDLIGVVVTTNLPPQVTITSPPEHLVYPVGTTINVQVAATDPDGSISKVELSSEYGRPALIDTTAPYSFAVSGLQPRPSLGLTVAAYDNLGKRSLTSVGVDIGIQVSAHRGNISPYDPLQGMNFYTPGQIVTATAIPPQPGMMFDQWSGDVADLDNPFLAVAKVKVPNNHHVSLEALFKPVSNPTLTKFVLMNADNNLPIAGYDPLYSGALLTLSKLPTRNLNVRAVTKPEPTGSVHFVWDAGLSGTFNQRENSAPYSLAEDTNGDYKAWKPAAGNHTLTAWAYAGKDRTGTVSLPLTINLKVVE